MRRCLTSASFVALAMSFAVPALAQEKPASSNCPGGAWFCEDVEVDPAPVKPATPAQPVQPAQPAQPVQPVQPDQVEPAPAGPEQHRPHVIIHQAPGSPPPVVVYQPGPPPVPAPHVIIVTGGYHHPPPRPLPPPQYVRPVWHPEWGINMRLEGLALGQRHGAADAAGMGGLGMSLRFRPVPAFAFDAGVDLIGGTDYNGFERAEIPVSINGILFVNPRSRVQFYFMGGATFSHAEVRSDSPSPLLHPDGDKFTNNYSYFGGQGGIGLEFRVSRHVALNIDGLGFVRKRTDDHLKEPEFFDASTGKTTNTSGGGIFRGGLTLWW